MAHAQLHALGLLFAAFVDHPEPGALVVSCLDSEVFYLIHTLMRLDEDSPADRFLLVAHPFSSTSSYLSLLDATVAAKPPLTAPALEASDHVEGLLKHLLAGLPPGDHRLICALIPGEIHDHAAFNALAEGLLRTRIDPRLRLVLRDDSRAPRHFATAAACPSEHNLAYRFSLPPDGVLADNTGATHDPRRSPDDRAKALLQLACGHISQQRYIEALTCCDEAAHIASTSAIRNLAFALQADTHRHAGDLPRARAVGTASLQLAAADGDLPVVIHVAMALGGLNRELGLTADAIKCFTIAERAAAHDPRIQGAARSARIALEEYPC